MIYVRGNCLDSVKNIHPFCIQLVVLNDFLLATHTHLPHFAQHVDSNSAALAAPSYTASESNPERFEKISSLSSLTLSL